MKNLVESITKVMVFAGLCRDWTGEEVLAAVLDVINTTNPSEERIDEMMVEMEGCAKTAAVRTAMRNYRTFGKVS